MSNVNLESWDQVRDWCDELGSFKPSYLELVNSQLYPKDAFSLGQMASKIWLKNCLQVVPIESNTTWALLGCWIGSLVPLLHDSFSIERLYGFDLDPVAVSKSEIFNRRYVENSWKYKGVVADVSMLSTDNMEFQTGGELIEVTPNVVINTSCEHMDTSWFETASNKQLIVMQTNDSPDFDGHINTCQSIDDMQSKYPLSDTRYVGTLKTPVYTRFMQIGYK
jgi:hypothetical protein